MVYLKEKAVKIKNTKPIPVENFTFTFMGSALFKLNKKYNAILPLQHKRGIVVFCKSIFLREFSYKKDYMVSGHILHVEGDDFATFFPGIIEEITPQERSTFVAFKLTEETPVETKFGIQGANLPVKGDSKTVFCDVQNLLGLNRDVTYEGIGKMVNLPGEGKIFVPSYLVQMD